MLRFFSKNKYVPLIIFSIFYIVFSFLTYKDWPIANGEEFRYFRGKETLEHLLHGEFTELLIQPRPHFFIYNGYTALQNLLNPNFYFEWFHLINLLFSLFIFCAVYVLALELFKKPIWAAFPMVVLVLFPTFFGQMAINPIDMPFTVFYLFSILAILNFGRKRLRKWQIVTLGLLFGVSQALRQLGLGLYVLLFLFQLIKEKNIVRLIKKRFFEYLLIFVVANFFLVITWPNFAINYFKSFAWYLAIGKDFYLWDFGLFYGGKILTNSERPLSYLPWFQFLTSPLFLIASLGFAVIYFNKLRRNSTFLLLVLALGINYALYFVLNPVLYDGTRHFLYLLPIITLVSLAGLAHFLEKTKSSFLKIVVVIFISLNLVSLVNKTIQTFPYHYVYFNKVASFFGNPYYLYESDYSSTLYKPAAEWVRDEYLNSNLITKLKVYACDNGYAVDYYSHKEFTVVLDTEEADLIICDYRTLNGFKGGRNVSGNIIYENGYEGFPIIYVFER